jgi:hypothetical protein
MPPPRLSDTVPLPSARLATAAGRATPAYEVLKVRVLVRVQDRFDPGKSRRMPASLFQQTARQQVEQVVDAEAPRLAKPDRERLIEEVFREAFGFGPLEELFPDQTVKEILVLGPLAVVVRRDGGWVPTNVKFRDAEHLQEVLDRVVGAGEPLAPGLGFSAIDVRLHNGFRVVAVMPPPVLKQPTTALFVRGVPGTGAFSVMPRAATPPPVPPPSEPHPAPPANGRPASPAPVGSPLASTAPGEQQFARHRARITERIISKLASLGVYDVNPLDVNELRRVIAAYVEEYCRTEKTYLSDPDQGRLTLEILTGMRR